VWETHTNWPDPGARSSRVINNQQGLWKLGHTAVPMGAGGSWPVFHPVASARLLFAFCWEESREHGEAA
jgi:hypothetical protein